MVVNPEQAGQKNLARNVRLLKQLEKKIDEALIEDFMPGSRKDICMNVPEELYPGTPVYQRLMEMYEGAGWKVEYQSDQREGAWLRFTPKGGGREW